MASGAQWRFGIFAVGLQMEIELNDVPFPDKTKPANQKERP